MGSAVCYVGVDRVKRSAPSRVRVIIDTDLRWDGGPDRKVTIANLSDRGCMVDCDGPMPIGHNVMLMIPAIGWSLATVRWSEGGRFGARFADPISMEAFWRANPPFDYRDARLRDLGVEPELPAGAECWEAIPGDS